MSRPKNSKDKTKRTPRRCYKSELLIGKTFGRWTVLEIVSRGKNIKVSARCSCGYEGVRHASTIAYGKSISCGCFHKEEMSLRQTKPDNHSAKLKLYNNYLFGARSRDIEFTLSFDDLFSLSQQQCHYCHINPEQIISTPGGKISYNGIDRVNTLLGYTKENCVACCKECNYTKGHVTPDIIYLAYKFIYEK